MININYDSEGKILAAYDSTCANIPEPTIEVTDQAWSDAHAPFMVASVDVEALTLKVTEVHDYVKEFSAETAIGREAQVFTGEELIRLMPYSYTLNELIRFKNFWGGVANGVPYAGLQQISSGLVSAGLIQASDREKLANVLLEQHIVLDPLT